MTTFRKGEIVEVHLPGDNWDIDTIKRWNGMLVEILDENEDHTQCRVHSTENVHTLMSDYLKGRKMYLAFEYFQKYNILKQHKLSEGIQL